MRQELREVGRALDGREAVELGALAEQRPGDGAGACPQLDDVAGREDMTSSMIASHRNRLAGAMAPIRRGSASIARQNGRMVGVMAFPWGLRATVAASPC